MDVDRARSLLGVSETDEWHVVRACYRRLIRDVHPDVSEAPPHRAIELNEAYAVLSRAKRAVPAPAAPARARTGGDAGPATRSPPPAAPPRHGVRVAGPDTILLAAPPDTAFLVLLDAGHHVGEISYVDRSSGIFEVIVRVAGETCSLLVMLEPRAHGTEAVLAVESIERVASLPAEPLLRALVAAMG